MTPFVTGTLPQALLACPDRPDRTDCHDSPPHSPRLRPHADRHLLPLVTLCATPFIWLTAGPNGAAQGPLDQALATLRLRDAARDEILMLDGKAPDAAALAATAVHGPALFLVRNAGGTRHVLVDPWSKAAGPHPVGGANVLDPDVVVF